jgi:hypothetical protein
MNGVSRPPGRTWSGRCCCSAAPSPRSGQGNRRGGCRRRRARGRHETTRRCASHHRVRGQRGGAGHPHHRGRAIQRPAPVQPALSQVFDFRSSTPNDPVLSANELLKTMDRDSTRALPDRPPAVRNSRAHLAARPFERQRHLGRWQSRLPCLRGLPSANRGREGWWHQR